MDVSTASDVVTRLRARAAATPKAIALTFLDGAIERATAMTCGELDGRARAVAARLQASTKPGSRALLIHAPGFDFVVDYLGCLYAGIVAVPTYAPHPARLRLSVERIQSVARDASPHLILTSTLFAPVVGAITEGLPGGDAVEVIDTRALDHAALASAFRPARIAAESVAFLQYTSGSTSSPKGVRITHGNLIHNLGEIQRLAADAPQPCGVSWLPPYHDMGLIGGILQPLWAGFPAVLFSPLDFLQRPLLWLETISHFRATVSPLPNFALELCIRRIAEEDLPRLDLSTWQVAINGAEPVRKDTLDRFTAKFASRGFRAEVHRPVYGLAEATLMASCSLARVPPRSVTVRRAELGGGRVMPVDEEHDDATTLVSCGRSIGGQTLRIVDPQSRRPTPPGHVGEIWLRGPSVAAGYWERPAETASIFGAYVDDGDGPFLRTGDLGFVDDGELFITGRSKDLVIVDGRNYYPQDFELAVERAHPGIRRGASAAFGVEDAVHGERVVIVAEVDARKVDGERLDEVKTRLRQTVRAALGLDVETVLLESGALPKTSSGKVQRARTRQAFLDGTLARIDLVAPDRNAS